MKWLFGATLTNWFRRLLRNSKYRWAIILGSLFYLFSPLDISPDVFPIIGWIDDGLLVTLVVTELTQMAMDNRHRIKNSTQQADSTDDEADYENVIDVESVRVG